MRRSFAISVKLTPLLGIEGLSSLLPNDFVTALQDTLSGLALWPNCPSIRLAHQVLEEMLTVRCLIVPQETGPSSTLSNPATDPDIAVDS